MMRIVLLVLSSEAKLARDALLRRFTSAEIEEIPRTQLEVGGMAQRLSALRSLRPDIFAVATERLAWQRGQNAFLLFGALAGSGPMYFVASDRFFVMTPDIRVRDTLRSSLSLSVPPC